MECGALKCVNGSLQLERKKERKGEQAFVISRVRVRLLESVSQSVALELRLERTKTSRTSEDLKQVGRVRSEKCKQK